LQVFLERLDVELPDLFPIVEALSHRVGLGIVLVQDVEVQRLGPPLHVRHAGRRGAAVHHRAFAGSVHILGIHI
jgi:hypothetical protein